MMTSHTEVFINRFSTRCFILVPHSSAPIIYEVGGRTTRQYQYVYTQLVKPISHSHKSLSHSSHKRQAQAGGWSYYLTAICQFLSRGLKH